MTFIGFVLSNSVREKITTAQAEYKSLSSALHFGHFEYFGLSRKSIKLANLSPDAIAQLSFQLAFYKQYGEFVPTYESCSTAAFLKVFSIFLLKSVMVLILFPIRFSHYLFIFSNLQLRAEPSV